MSGLVVGVAALLLVLAGCSGNTASVDPPANGTTSPSAPTNLSAVGGSAQIALSWLASTASSGITAYLVERCAGTNCTTFAQIASLGGAVTNYIDGGLISDTTYSYRVRSEDASGNFSSYSNVASATTGSSILPPVVTSGTATGTVGTSFSYQIAATNSPTSYGASGFPAGLTVNATSGLVSGTPTSTGAFNVTLSATNSGGTGTASLSLTVNAALPVITSTDTATGTVGTSFSYQIAATNSPTTYGASGLPAGLTVSTTSGLISGNPTSAGTFNVTLTATNSGGTGSVSLSLTILSSGLLISHTVQISNDADDGYYNSENGTGWHSTPEYDGADLVGSWNGLTTAWVTGYRFPSVGANSGDTIQSAYLQLTSSDGFATSAACGSAPCNNSNYTFRVYGVAQDDGPPFSGATGNTPLDVPYTAAYTDYTTTGPGDDAGSCQGQNNGQNTCTHTIDVTNIVREITSQSGWTNTSAMRFVMLSTDPSAPNVYAGYEDYSANPSKAATLVINPPLPTIVSSGAWGTGASTTYPTSYATGPFVYPGASTLLLFLGDYYDFNGQPIPQPTVSDNCGNTWNILAGPTNWAGISYYMRSTVYYVQNPAQCAAGATITVTVGVEEPIFLHFLAVAGSDTANPPTVSAITSPNPGTYTTSATSDSIVLNQAGLLVSWIFGDSDAPTVFTPQAGFTADPNSTPTYLTAAFENVLSPGSYQSQFSISPSDGWQVVIIGLQAP